MLVLGWMTAGVMAWVFVLVVETGTKGGGAGWLAIGVSRGTWVIAGAGGSCPMAGRLEPTVYNWVKWVTWGIVITIEKKKKKKTKCFLIYFCLFYLFIYLFIYLYIFCEPKWAVLGDSCATSMLCLLTSWSYWLPITVKEFCEIEPLDHICYWSCTGPPSSRMPYSGFPLIGQ